MKLLKIIGSLYIAIFLIGALALILILSTTLESLYGTPFVQRFFYGTGWFDVLLSLIFINIFCSTFTRWPFKKYHTGFIITHIGILLLLFGSLLTRLSGVEGQMALLEGETQDNILQNTHRLVIHRHNSEGGWTREIDLENSSQSGQSIRLQDTPMELKIDELWKDAVEATEIVEGPGNAAPNPAIRLTLSSDRAGVRESIWLSTHNPSDPNSAQIAMGPAMISLKTQKPTAKLSSTRVRVIQQKTGKEFAFNLDPLPKEPLAVNDSGLTITHIRYFPDARVKNKTLVSISDKPNNPAVEFTVSDASGVSEQHTKFSLFPDFQSLHGRTPQNHFDLELRLDTPESSETEPKGPRAALTFYDIHGKWSYASKSSSGETSNEIETGKNYTAGWMDFSFRVENLMERAAVEQKVRHARSNEKGDIAVRVSLLENGKPLTTHWVMPGKPFRFGANEGPIAAIVEAKHSTLPFALKLDDFRKIDYPGTSNASAYESDVTLTDPKDGITIKKKISMNKPLDYKGYRVFQSSYIPDPMGDTSIFTVAKNPGIRFIYSGAVIMFLGVITIFYIKPFSSFSQLNSKGGQK